MFVIGDCERWLHLCVCRLWACARCPSLVIVVVHTCAKKLARKKQQSLISSSCGENDQQTLRVITFK